MTGIGTSAEAEQRATSALLAVLTVVRDLSIALLGPLGAPKAKRADVEAFTEVRFQNKGKHVRPDGLIEVTYGDRSWRALVEVKTKTDRLMADQVNKYWDIARTRGSGYHCVLTISNEIASAPGVHPTDGLRVRPNSPTPVFHLSWSAILTTAIRIREHTPVDDTEQAWILDQLIRYLEHPASGALAFDDMGPHWVSVRQDARSSTLSKKSDGVRDVVSRWDQLIRFAALKLASEIGEDVQLRLIGKQKDPKNRQADLADQLATTGSLSAALHIPKTAGELVIHADLKATQLDVSVSIQAPDDKGPVGTVSWLVNQIKGGSGHLSIEAYPKNQRTPNTASLASSIEDRNVLLGEDRKKPYRFRIVSRAPMGIGRKAGKRGKSFIDSVLTLIDSFYGTVIQEIDEWRPATPKMKPPADSELDNRGLLDQEPT